MTVAHSTLTGASLHENKGVSSAADNTVATASGGATVWKKLGINNMASDVFNFSNKLLNIQDQKPSGTTGGASIVGWTTRTLNTTIVNGIPGASLASNQITLPAGTYYVEASAPTSQVGVNLLRIRNVSDSTDIKYGPVAVSPNNWTSQAYIQGRFTIASSKIISLQHYTENAVAEGLGKPASLGISEVYANICIWQI